MTDIQMHHKDHERMLNALDCSQKVAALDKDVSLLHLQIREMKADKEKSNRMLFWVCGMAFTIIMAVAGSLISSTATIQVLQEKVAEQKSEIENITSVINEMYSDLADHEHVTKN